MNEVDVKEDDASVALPSSRALDSGSSKPVIQTQFRHTENPTPDNAYESENVVQAASTRSSDFRMTQSQMKDGKVCIRCSFLFLAPTSRIVP